MTFESKNRKKDYVKSENDFYITPRKAIIDIFKKEIAHLDRSISILDAGCGNGVISEVLKEHGFTNVTSLDLVDRGYESTIVMNLLNHDIKYDLVISNPPYGRGIVNNFVAKCLELSKQKTIIFCRWQLLETQNRYNLLFNNVDFKMSWMYLYSNRVACINPLQPQASKSMMNYAWFVWEKGYNDIPKLDWIDKDDK